MYIMYFLFSVVLFLLLRVKVVEDGIVLVVLVEILRLGVSLGVC